MDENPIEAVWQLKSFDCKTARMNKRETIEKIAFAAGISVAEASEALDCFQRAISDDVQSRPPKNRRDHKHHYHLSHQQKYRLPQGGIGAATYRLNKRFK